MLEAGLPDDVAEVLSVAARGPDATYRITYETDGRTVTITQRPPDRRLDGLDDDGTADSTITVAGRTHACTDPPGEEDGWRCDELGEAPRPGVFDDAAVDEFVNQLRFSTDDHEFAVDDDEVAGVDVRCVVSTPLGDGATATSAPARLCVAEEGAILLVERPAGTLRAAEYTTEVPDGAFELPA